MKSKTDEHLIEAIERGRPDALDELYRRHARGLFVFCARSMRIRHPEDIVHDVFTRVIEAAGTFDARRGSVRTWLLRIARNRCIDLYRREGRARVLSLDRSGEKEGGLAETIAGASMGPDEAVARAATAAAVRKCLRALESDLERQALVLYHLSAQVYREIALILGKSTTMAQKYVKSARAKMRRCLQRKGVTV